MRLPGIFFDMPIRIVWEEKQLDEEFKTFSFKKKYKELDNPLFCGKFNKPIFVEDLTIEFIHFTEFKYYEDDAINFYVQNITRAFNVSGYENLCLYIVKPGIIRWSLLYFIYSSCT